MRYAARLRLWLSLLLVALMVGAALQLGERTADGRQPCLLRAHVSWRAGYVWVSMCGKYTSVSWW